MQNKHLVALFLMFFFWPVSQLLACPLQIVNVGPVIFSWNTSGQTLQRDITIKRGNPGNNACRRYHLALTNGAAGNINRKMFNNAANLPYNFYRNAALSQIIRDHPNVNSQNHVINGQFNLLQTQKVVSFYLNYPAPPYLSSVATGQFSDNLQLKLYRGYWDNMISLDDTQALTPTLQVPTYTAISLIETGAPFNAADTFQLLDFGTLETNESMDFDIAVESNISYNLTMSSANNGNMKLLGGPDTITYSIQIGPNTYSLVGSQNNPMIVSNHLGTTNQGGFRHPVSVVIGSVANKSAGTYQDTITIEAVAQ